MNHLTLPATIIILLTCMTFCRCHTKKENANSPSQVLQKFFSQCSQKKEIIKCLKIQALKVTDRALQLKALHVADGLNIVSNERSGRGVGALYLNESKLEKLTHPDLDSLLGDRFSRFLDTHKVEVNIPKLIQESGTSFSEETGRKRGGGGGKNKGGEGYLPLLAALAIKGSFLAIAYKGIAVMSGMAILIGKMALILSAILGLKKLVSGSEEKTTFEIIKTPKYAEEHVQSSAYEDDHLENYRRNYLEPREVQKRIYRFQIPDH